MNRARRLALLVPASALVIGAIAAPAQADDGDRRDDRGALIEGPLLEGPLVGGFVFDGPLVEGGVLNPFFGNYQDNRRG